MKPKTKRILRWMSYSILGLLLFAAVGMFGAYRYAMYSIFRDTPNTLVFEGELCTVPFQWSPDVYEDYTEPHAAILIPVSVPGIPNQLFMQFDTGAADTFFRIGALKSMQGKGAKFDLIEEDGETFVSKLELNIAGNRVVLNSGHVIQRETSIDWEDSDAINIIGSLGADFLSQKVCEIDFPAQEIRFHQQRPERLNELGEFSPFKFQGRRILLPAEIDGAEVQVFYDSGCSAFGLLTSKYHYDRLTNPNDQEIAYGASRHGESVPIHHKASDLQVKLGTTKLSIRRISYAELYNFLQSTFGRMVGGGFLGNQCLLESTLIIDAQTNEFLVVNESLSSRSSGENDNALFDRKTSQ